MKQVLIAEDDSDLRTIFARIFLISAFEVRLAVDGRETLAQLAEAVPDILILDINMPHISGLDVLT
jgi:DNA-binding response OmpR family regulator